MRLLVYSKKMSQEIVFGATTTDVCLNLIIGYLNWGQKKQDQKIKVLPGFEPGLSGSKPKVITTTL